MSLDSKIIHLTTPVLDSRINPNTPTKQQAVRKLVDNLPSANPTGMARELLSTLKLLNRHPKKIPQRSNIMMIFMDPFQRILDMARKINCQNHGGRGPNRNNQELTILAEAICSEMAYGFKHVINNDLSAETKIPPNKCAEFIDLAITCLSSGLILDMVAYRPESHTARREIFQLLIRAQQLGIASQQIAVANIATGYEKSALNSFKTAVLISILDPSRLTPREIWGAYDYLSWYAKNARITSVEQASQQPGNYLITRDGMQKPVLLNPEKPPSNPGKFMVLETRRLNILISRHLDILSDDSTALIRGSENLNPDIKKHLLRQMLHIWHTNPQRRCKREQKFDRISCAFGIGSVYAFVKEGTMRIPYSDPDSHEDMNHPGPGVSGILDTYECRQENISANGMMIISSNQNITKLKVGQMIVTESLIGEELQPLKIGVVRRISHRDQDTIEFGVQFIPGEIYAATALPEIIGHKHEVDLQPCVVLELGKDKPKTLITPNLTYQVNRHYVLDINEGDSSKIIAGKMLESTACFDCFEYNVLEHY